MIERAIYIERIKPFINKQLIKVLTGQRRVGKSAVLLLLIDEIKKQNKDANIIYIDKEDYGFSSITNDIELNNYIIQNKKENNNYLFIDEVQEIKDFEKVLRSYYKKDNFDIFITGSNANIFSSELSTHLSGRQIEFSIGSLSFNEFCLFHMMEQNQETLFEYIKYGGLPYLMHLPKNEKVRFEYLKNIFDTILFRDIVKRNKIRDPNFLTDLLRFLADNTGSLFSANSISKYLKSQRINKNVQIIINYLTYIEDACFINNVKRTDIKGKAQFDVGGKYYFEDIGLRNSIVGFKMQDIEKIIENTVYLHLKNSDYVITIGDYNGKEIDFIASKNNEISYFQVCYLLESEKTIKREFGNLLAIKDNYPKYVISFDSFSTSNTYRGVIHYTLLKFLSEFQ
ncbi:MAG: ATP-binding protein [Salinivirgaceae bacterium]|nr:ATP-binding protein [Salinivirgaceae bacterium]